ncbi:type I secretion system permease/ATPase [Laribacter hongkongensis]|uniref:Cyclolysin secretion/processing ATP-binding protein CyaB n=1 Tax=Laribacter hongkongensis TaxID=168471 RepID=A0A248LMD5_9NEIS|nr:type I secretion system permease/ATPase [Laribacter hongkongensis]ASJ25927.1 putative ABC transporter, ATP-binding/permease fusion [Laribacter hongkongensis]MCG8995766.1 type I secretion system permease/ATPase [Laribacter hongkongensis]MCG9009921.1 type I secretion system permease/ATPase [Laribacter hongkongensis]MCG9023455.1 type I secretion system permease/ATPase [Laribacter hongkongensis]MCG9032238.1 type I secretion system permease/ATPase [Laribacter hongkongensis]
MDSSTAPDPGAQFSRQSTHVDPLLDCLFSLARAYGIATTREALVAGIPLVEHRLTPSMFARSARRIGLVSRVVRQPLTSLRADLLPAVLLLKDNEACILRGIKGDMAQISYPELPDSTVDMPLDTLMANHLGLSIFVKPRFSFERRAPELAEIRSRHWFWGTVYSSWPLYRDALVAALLINLFALVTPIVTMNVYDRVVPNMATDTLWVLTSGAALVLLFDFMLKVTRGYLVDLASKRIDVTLSALIMERVLGVRMEARPASVGAFAANLRAFETVRDFIASASITGLIDLPFALIFILAIGWVSPWMMLPVVAGGVLMLGFAWLVQEKMQELTETTLRAASQKNAHLVENLANLDTLKVLAAEGEQQGKWEQSTLFLAQVGTRLKLLASSTVNFSGLIQQTTSIAMLVLGVYLIMNGLVSQGGVIAAVMLCGRAMAPLGQVVGLLTQYHNARTSLGALDSFMKLPVEREKDVSFFHRTHFKGEIEFRDVSFNYPASPLPSLDNVSFRIRAGERVAIIGRVGSGKSTLQKLILGLFRPTGGSIRVDGIDTNQIDPAELRRNIGYVPQDVVLFYGSLRDNIAMGSPHVHDASVAAAADQAGLTGFVNSHPQGFDMIIGERGDTLSGGQRKAVAIARALLNSPPILLLDEPTSNMDHSTERQIYQTLESVLPGRTLVLVTHHNALLSLVDRLIVIDQGRIVADGPKAQVMQALQGGQVTGVAA